MKNYKKYLEESNFKSCLHLNRYIKLIEYVKSHPNKRSKGCHELHHILPRSMFPEHTDKFENKILLTNRQHFIAHLLLWKKLILKLTLF